MGETILSLQGINKSFGPIDVLHDISLEVKAGEVLCLLGDNGAGKSTVIRLLSGVHQPTSGQMVMDGQPVLFRNPREAADHGIATVHQFGGTFPLMSFGRSFFVGREPTRWCGPLKIYDRKKANEIAVKAVQKLGITRIDDRDRLVGGLSGGERQALAIARAVHFGARVLILDEPTAALGVKQATHVLRIVNEARKRGLAVIFITHQVMHAMAVGDHFAVLIRFDHGARSFIIVRSPSDTFHAMDGHCSHEKVHLCDGLVMDHTVECPKHAGVFDYRTGEAKRAPACINLRTYPVKVEDGQVYIEV